MARAKTDTPETLLEAVRYFADEDVALLFFANLRWPTGEQECPKCGSVREHSYLKTRRLWKCRERECGKQFSAKVGTVLEDSPIKLSKWLPAIWILANTKNGTSSAELARTLGVTQKTAWFMLHRIRLAMQSGSFDKMKGEVEVDETFIGGKGRFMHKNKKDRLLGKKRRGVAGKVAVMGLLERHGEDGRSRVRTTIVPNVRRHSVQPEVRANVETGAELFTDALRSYHGLADEYVHKVIDHAEAYARGKVHTNGLENFWSLVKRALKGTYISVEPFHLFRYLDEQSFRFNTRHDNDAGRFMAVLSSVAGRRLTYAGLTGAEAGQQ